MQSSDLLISDHVCQPLSESEDEAGLMAYRTRSKRPLRNIPLGRLEAELRAPDITPDMYDLSSAPKDREWTDWLRGLMSSDMDNEGEEQPNCKVLIWSHNRLSVLGFTDTGEHSDRKHVNN